MARHGRGIALRRPLVRDLVAIVGSQGSNLPARHIRNVTRQYWVDASGGSDATSEATARDSSANPWATIQHAIDTCVLPTLGDCAINVRNTGVYQETTVQATAIVEKAGLTTSKRFIIRSDQDAKPVVRMAGGATGAQHDCFQIRSSFTILDNFDCDSSGRPGPASGDNDGTGIFVNMSGSPDGAVECWNMDVHDLVMANNPAAAKAQGLFSEAASPLAPIQFINCKVWNIGPANEGESQNNLEHAVYGHGNLWFINCLMYDCLNGFVLQIYNGGAVVDKIYVVHCTLALPTDLGVVTVDPRNSTNIEFRNSIIYGAPSGQWNISNTQGTAPSPGAAGVIDHVINKAIAGLGAIANAADFTISNHNTTDDPQFADVTTRNFQLLPDSPAVGFSDTLWSPPFDLLGRERPAGAEDAGALQMVPPQIARPDADTVTTGWTATPLFSKVNDESDATLITATAS